MWISDIRLRFTSALGLLLILLLTVPSIVHAQDDMSGGGSSPWPPPIAVRPLADDDLIVVSENDDPLGSDLNESFCGQDTEPLTIRVPFGRYVGEVDGDGFLTNASDLIDEGLIPPFLEIRLPVLDIDDDGELRPEMDEIYVNGELVGTLYGANDE